MSDNTTPRVGIETTFNGVKFRSRLEARWAAFMTCLGWEWTYEPFDARGYIPDFAVTGSQPLLIEVKPGINMAELGGHVARLEQALDGMWEHDVLVVGASPFLPSANRWDALDRSPGLLGEWGDWDNNPGWGWDEAAWKSCGECKQIGVAHSMLSYVSRPCGYYDGNIALRTIDAARLQMYWADATNAVKWRP